MVGVTAPVKKRAREEEEVQMREEIPESSNNAPQKRKAGKSRAHEGNAAHPVPLSHKVLVTELNADVRHIYTRTLQQMVPRVVRPPPAAAATPVDKSKQQQENTEKKNADEDGAAAAEDASRSKDKEGSDAAAKKQPQVDAPSPVTLVQDAEGAVMCIAVRSKKEAEILQGRMHNARVFGRKWKCRLCPKKDVECASDPCLVDIAASAEVTAQEVANQLAVVSGFLGAELVVAEKAEGVSEGMSQGQRQAEEDEEQGAEEGRQFVASFASEGGAIHARAVLSGRPLASGKAHLFLSRRR